MLDDLAEYERMAAAEGELWWYRALHERVAQALNAHPKGHAAKVVDAGCGTGGLLQFLSARGYKDISGFDVSPAAVEICQHRGFQVQVGDLREFEHLVKTGSADVIISNDTLYFFQPAEQQQILRAFWQGLAAGGLLVLNLPALECFRGMHDIAVGIPKRFTKADVARLLSPTDFQVEQVRFWPFLLSPMIYAVRASQRLHLRLGTQGKVRSDVDVPPKWLNEILLGLTRLEKGVASWAPFGSSLFVVARKRGQGLVK